jgi:1,4-dihydroxy-2-naphthoate octaprenyltransferase
MAFVGALGAHISVNALNEYFDFRSGLDLRTRRTPFSGGSGTLPAKPSFAGGALVIGLSAGLLSASVGLYFLISQGLGLLPVGVLGLTIIGAYTPWLTKDPLLCLVAPGTGFGLLMVMGTNYALTGTYTWTSAFAALLPFFLVNNLLLLNQFPDVEADRSVGRRHLPIVAGRESAARVYALFHTLVPVTILVGILIGVMPIPTALGFLATPLAIINVINVLRRAEADAEELLGAMGSNVLLNLVTPVLVGLGFLLA